MLIADEGVAKGKVDHVPVYPRKVMRRALALNASMPILVHNHPTPSEADVAMALDAMRTLGIALHDHIVGGISAEVSLRSEGLL